MGRNSDLGIIMLSAKDILNCSDETLEKITVPEWGGDVYIRTLTGSERDGWELYYQDQLSKTNNVNVRAKLAGLTLCDETGKRLFSDGQLAQLGAKSGKALDRVYSAAIALNKISEDEIKALEKN